MSYLSVIMTGRDDDHCAGFTQRMQNSINTYGYFADLFKFDFEIVIVEWCPPDKRLVSVLRCPSPHLTIRIITVPKKVHNQIESTKFDAPGANEMNFFLGIAQNVGIQRANGTFILTTNGDIIPNETLMKFLSLQELSTKTFYRIYRYDMEETVSTILGPPQAILIYEREAKRRGNLVSPGIVHKKAAGDFILAHVDVFSYVRGFPEIRCDGLKIDGEILDNMSQFVGQTILENPFKIFHQYHYSRYLRKYDRKSTIRLFGQGKVKFQSMDDRTKLCVRSVLMNQNRISWGLIGIKLKEITL